MAHMTIPVNCEGRSKTRASRPYNRSMPAAGLVLFAHGSRDGRWAEPFERLHARVARALPDAQVVLAYLELMPPDLPTAAAALCAAGCRAIVVVPVFLGQGGHVRHDLPLLVQSAAARHPECEFRLVGAAGEDDIVLDAIAAFCLRQLAA
jgi:sirohydrochlorin cobaltochelatase